MTQVHRPLAAALWMAGSIAGFSLVAVAGRALAPALDTFEVMLYRSLVGFVIVTAAALLSGVAADLRPRHMTLHFFRNVVHFAGQNLWLYALSLIPLAQLFALEFSYPIMVALTAPLFLGERLTRTKVVTAAIGFAGILIVARPFGMGGLSPGLIGALLCALGFAGAAIFTKRLTRLTSITAILFWMTVMQTGFGLAGALSDGRVALPPTALWPWVLVIGAGGLGAHYSLTKALSLAPASLVTPIDFLRLPLIALVGMAFYGEPFDPWVFAGGAVIFAANWLNIRVDANDRKAALGGFSAATSRHSLTGGTGRP
jgi:drug/metabolite transporter (DMT)-like permease